MPLRGTLHFEDVLKTPREQYCPFGSREERIIRNIENVTIKIHSANSYEDMLLRNPRTGAEIEFFFKDFLKTFWPKSHISSRVEDIIICILYR